MLSVAYLGSPYWHENPDVRVWRAVTNARAVTLLSARPDGENEMVYSPVAYGHHIDALSMTPGNNESYWRRHGIAMLRRSDSLIVLQLEGWEVSKGLAAEIDLAQRLNMPITYLDPEELGLSASMPTPGSE